ncbi:hypothetical protein NDU88_004445 [Pleurodeles waltl]|uniref:Uncharacterized protein n=1 Tax=Pleurodeles waltl TaxID=8319 RepID=A0AAV7VIZ6_PLEWA|nr:hypothetical protein NDU88_004445 [Pleurodeles waltl]
MVCLSQLVQITLNTSGAQLGTDTSRWWGGGCNETPTESGAERCPRPEVAADLNRRCLLAGSDEENRRALTDVEIQARTVGPGEGTET